MNRNSLNSILLFFCFCVFSCDFLFHSFRVGQRVACDWGIDSKAQEDRCGVCHGDGTQCNTIRGNYTEPDGIDYIEMVVIPKGARNIRFVEADEAANYIAIQSVETNEYYLNGQWYTESLTNPDCFSYYLFFKFIFK